MYVILFAIFIDLVGFGLIIPILPFITMGMVGDGMTIELFAGTSMTLSAATLGTSLMAVYSLAAFIVGPLWGRLSDRIGRKLALATTFLGSSAAYVLLAHAETFWMVFLARALSGSMAGNVGIVMAAIADMTDESNRGKAMGLIGASFGLGFAVGPGLGGLLAEVGGPSKLYYPGLAAAAMSMLALILTLWQVPETNMQDEEDTDILSRPSRRAMLFESPNQFFLMLMFMVSAMSQSLTFSIFPFWASATLAWDEKAVGLMMMGMGLVIFLCQSTLAGWLFKRFGEVRTITLGGILNLFGCSLVVFLPPSVSLTFTAFPLLMVGLVLAFPALSSILSRRTHKSIQGTVLGFSGGISALGRVAGPLSAGYLFLPESPGTPFYGVIAIGILITAWSVLDPFLSRAETPKSSSSTTPQDRLAQELEHTSR